jgi:hypothetical protein
LEQQNLWDEAVRSELNSLSQPKLPQPQGTHDSRKFTKPVCYGQSAQTVMTFAFLESAAARTRSGRGRAPVLFVAPSGGRDLSGGEWPKACEFG